MKYVINILYIIYILLDNNSISRNIFGNIPTKVLSKCKMTGILITLKSDYEIKFALVSVYI